MGVNSPQNEKNESFFFVLLKILKVPFYRGITCSCSPKIMAVIAKVLLKFGPSIATPETLARTSWIELSVVKSYKFRLY